MASEFTEHLERYLEHMRSINCSPTTIRTRAYCVREFLHWLNTEYGIRTPGELTSMHMRSWQVSLSKRRTTRGNLLKPRSVNKKIESVLRFLDDLRNQGHVSQAAAETLVYVKVPKLLPKAIRHEEMRELLDRMNTSTPEAHRNRTMLELLYSSGIRSAELLGLNVDSVDFEHAVVKVLGKGRKERVVPVGATALRFLESYLSAVRASLRPQPQCRALFPDDGGHRMPYYTLRRIVLRTGEEAGLKEPLTAHMFRRSCTSELVRGNANIYHVSRMLGHESLETLQHYVRLNITDIQETHRKTHPRERDEKNERGE